MRLKALISDITLLYQEASIENPRREAHLLMMHLLEVDELYLMMHSDDMIKESEKAVELARRRANHEPFEYISNQASFYSEHFYVDERVLIPRPETELLIDNIEKYVKMDEVLHVSEVGVGSGIISITLARKYPHIKIEALDISEEALAVAAINIKRFNLEDRITLRQSNLLENSSENIDLLVSNPPYIAQDAKLDRNLDYEPDLALFGGEVGDELVHQLLEAQQRKKIRYFACEYGYDQRTSVQKYISSFALQSINFYKDYSDFDRGFILEMK